MAKECSNCSSISDDQAPYCEGCGAQSWRRPGAEKEKLQHYIVATIILALLAAIYFRFVK